MGLRESIAEVVPTCVEIRHDLHRHPELGYEEQRTSQAIQQHLSDWGVDYVPGLARGTGVLAYLPSTTGGNRTVALRADMDALPILEDSGVAYSSQHPGVMHACGHDGHTAILLGVARILRDLERPHNVVLVFQPAEEGGAGGKAMCDDGVLDGTHFGAPVDEIFGLHGFPMGELGKVYTRNGPMMASTAELAFTIHGKGAHAAYPHMGIDPVVVAAHVVTALQSVAARTIDPLESVVVTIGKIEGGVAHNVIPDSVSMLGTLRTLNDGVRERASAAIERIVHQVAAAFGATADVRITNGYPVTSNDPDATDHVRRHVRARLGDDSLVELAHPSMGGEDFSFYGLHVPASFFFLGLRGPDQAALPNLHSPQFDFIDAAIPYGIEMMCSLATD